MNASLPHDDQPNFVNASDWLTHEMIREAISGPWHDPSVVSMLRLQADECQRVGATSLADELRGYAQTREDDADTAVNAGDSTTYGPHAASVVVSWSYSTASGVREFGNIEQATDWADVQLTHCPGMSIARES